MNSNLTIEEKRKIVLGLITYIDYFDHKGNADYLLFGPPIWFNQNDEEMELNTELHYYFTSVKSPTTQISIDELTDEQIELIYCNIPNILTEFQADIIKDMANIIDEIKSIIYGNPTWYENYDKDRVRREQRREQQRRGKL